MRWQYLAHGVLIRQPIITPVSSWFEVVYGKYQNSQERDFQLESPRLRKRGNEIPLGRNSYRYDDWSQNPSQFNYMCEYILYFYEREEDV